MPESDLLTLQRCFASLALDASAAAFESDAGAFAAVHGLPRRDQEAFRRFQDRLLYYRDAVREAIWEPMDRYLPLSGAVLEEAGALEECRAAFLATRALQSPFYRDVAPTFLGWLASSGWGQDRWPFLLQLVHFELVKELVEHGPEGGPPGDLHPLPAPGDRLVLAAPTQILAYAFQVHEATLDHPAPLPGPCHLLASRGGDGYIKWRVLTEATACLLTRAQSAPIVQTMGALGLEDLSGTLALLEELQGLGAIQGFRGPEAPDAS